MKDERERAIACTRACSKAEGSLGARSTPRGRRLVSSRLTKEKEKEKEKGGEARERGNLLGEEASEFHGGSGHRCNLATPLYGTNVVRSRVYERAPPVHAGVGRRWGHVGGRGGEISLRARVHGSRENREPTATAETAPRRQPGGDSSG